MIEADSSYGVEPSVAVARIFIVIRFVSSRLGSVVIGDRSENEEDLGVFGKENVCIE